MKCHWACSLFGSSRSPPVTEDRALISSESEKYFPLYRNLDTHHYPENTPKTHTWYYPFANYKSSMVNCSKKAKRWQSDISLYQLKHFMDWLKIFLSAGCCFLVSREQMKTNLKQIGNKLYDIRKMAFLVAKVNGLADRKCILGSVSLMIGSVLYIKI